MIKSKNITSSHVSASGVSSCVVGSCGHATGGGPTPPIGCVYPLDATDAQMQGVGFNGGLAMSNESKTFSRVITAGSAEYAAASAAFAGMDFSTGVKTINLRIDALPEYTPATGSYIIDVQFYNAVSARVFDLLVIAKAAAETDGPFAYTTYGSGGADIDGAGGLLSPPAVVGLTFDAVAGEVYAKIAGAVVTTTPYTPGALVPIPLVKTVSATGAAVGKTVTATLLTDYRDITEFVAGSTDICGNTIV